MLNALMLVSKRLFSVLRCKVKKKKVTLHAESEEI